VFNRTQPLISGIYTVLGINLVLAIPVFILMQAFPSQFNNINSGVFWFVAVPFFWLLGLTQLIYVIPLVIWLLFRGQMEVMKGVLIGAIITGILNGGGCYLLMVVGSL
jgi:hypothetical protein